MRTYPPVPRGQIIGLLGGSFDPPHAGHVHITRTALRRFGLDRVWWLVSPGNPLKPNPPAPLDRRMQAARQMMQHPSVAVTDIECELGTRYTAETIAALQARFPQARFVWLMGADNLAGFHRWQDWRQIMESVPIGVLARPKERISARLSKAARVYRAARIKGYAAQTLGQQRAPAWCFINMPMAAQSSTLIRNSGAWQSGVSQT